jgi:hypothetical protein
METQNIQEKMLDDSPITQSDSVPSKPPAQIDTRRCGAFWSRTGRNVGNYLSGQVTLEGKTYQVMIFKNDRKVKETHPDYEMVLSKNSTNTKDFI